MRVTASGAQTRTIRSALGIRAGFQYAAFLTSSARSRGTRRARRKGPVPEGSWAKRSQFQPTRSYCAGEEMRNQSIW